MARSNRPRESYPRGDDHPMSKATAEERAAAVYRVTERGETMTSVAQCFGVDDKTVRNWATSAGWRLGWYRP